MTCAQVERCALVVTAQQARHVFDAYLLVRLDADGKVLDAIRQAQRWSQLLHNKEFAYAVILDLLEVVGAAIGFPEAERFLAIPEFQLLGHLEHIVRCHIVVRVTQVEGADAGNVGRHSDFVVRDAHSSPYAAHLLGTFTENLKQPSLVFVGNGQALATVSIAIFLDQFTHQADGIAGGRATLQGNAGQFLNHENTLLVSQRVSSRDGRLAHCELFLIQAGIGGIKETVGVAHLRDDSRLHHAGHVGGRCGVEAVAIDGSDRIAHIVAGWRHRHPRAVACVTGVGSDYRAIGARRLTHHDAGTRFRHMVQVVLSADVHTRRHQQGSHCQEDLFHN